MKILFLGTGGSMGTPVIGCQCKACSSKDPKNHRLRPSILITSGKKRFLVDVGPDFRAQALRYGINSLDGLLLTHTHYDHIAGLDELRIYTFVHKKPIPCLLSKESLEDLKIRYHYFLPLEKSDDVHEPKLAFQLLENDQGQTTFEGLELSYFSYDQLGMKVNGFRFGSFAYVTDLLDYNETLFKALEGTQTLILNGRRFKKSKAHISIEEGIKIAKKIGAKKTYFTHISHEIEHEEASKKLPEGFFLAYDGLELIN
ncbi:MAG: MBL fold metallo-hydrolase [Chlamydiia bacterium]|nr:MBL fold metallo-hydrolase [Chlamydiia bacterium]